jgi:hypothetical protein
MASLDHAAATRRGLILATESPDLTAAALEAETQRDADRLEAKRNAARAYLGTRWVLSPGYAFNPRHSFDSTVWSTAPGPLDSLRLSAIAGGRL